MRYPNAQQSKYQSALRACVAKVIHNESMLSFWITFCYSNNSFVSLPNFAAKQHLLRARVCPAIEVRVFGVGSRYPVNIRRDRIDQIRCLAASFHRATL